MIPEGFVWPKIGALVIYDPVKKQFSSGGGHPWNSHRSMKVWKTIGNINSHLNVIREYSSYYGVKGHSPESVYKGCLVLDLINKEVIPWTKFKVDAEKMV